MVCAFAALGVVLCTSLMLAGPSAAMDMDSMPVPTSALTGVTAGVAAEIDTVASLGCEGTCVADATIACAAVGTIAFTLLIGLGRSRHSALVPRQTLERTQRTAGVEQPPWSVRTPSRLSVIRV